MRGIVLGCSLGALSLSGIACTDPSPSTYTLPGYSGHAEGVVRRRGSFDPIEGCRLSYTISLMEQGKSIPVTTGDRAVITDGGGNYEFDWVWVGACSPGARLEVRVHALQEGFLPLDTARVIGAPCATGSSFTFFSVYLTPGPTSVTDTIHGR